MQKHSLKFGKVFTNVTCFPLILISNNSELAAKYLPTEVDQSIKTLEIPNINNFLFQGIDIKIKGVQATLVKTFPNFEYCFCMILLMKIN